MRQLEFPSHGGRRKGAGRPRGNRVSHASRPGFERVTPVLVTLRVAAHVWNLRSARSWRVLRRAFASARGRFGLRLIEFSVLGNHLHFIVEADCAEALSRGMQGLNIRLAKALNRLMRSHGRVFADHYHARLLRSPLELVTAIGYVAGNAAHHYGSPKEDAYTSTGNPAAQEILSEPRGWLLRTGWRRRARRRVPALVDGPG